MKRDHQNEQEQEDDGNDSNHSGGQKRFRNNDETLRVLIPSRVSYSVPHAILTFIHICDKFTLRCGS